MSSRKKEAWQVSGSLCVENSNVNNSQKGKYHRLILAERVMIFVSEEALLLQSSVEEVSVAAGAQAPTKFFLC